MSTTITTNIHIINIIADHGEQQRIEEQLTSIRRCYEEQKSVTEQINALVFSNSYYYSCRDASQELKLELQKKWRETILSAIHPLARLDAVCVKHGLDSFMESLDAESSIYRVQSVLNLCAAIAQG